VTLEKRALGKSGYKIAPLVFGGNVLGWTIDQTKSFDVLDAFMASGFDCIDTADVYSRWKPGNTGGESETILGHWFKARGNRSKVILATKVGMEMGPEKKGLSKAYILKGVEDSLKRLQTDYIDLYQSHRDDMVTPVDESLEAYAQIIKAGKVRAVGASNFDTNRFGAALAANKAKGLPRYETMQPHYNLIDRADFEAGLQALCVKENVGVIPYYSLASGFLSGKYRSEADFGKSARGGGMKKYMNERGMRILKGLDEVSARHKSTQAQVALAWLMAQPSITAPIVSATSVEQWNDIAKSASLKLSADDLGQLTTASAA
jgi:aryl-alcohol dehydrogenase-like predicted oxidoreductase